MTSSSPSSSLSPNIDWRVRDVADEYLDRRRDALRDADGVFSSPPPMKLSTRFDVGTSQSRLLRDKAVLVRNAFDMAAVFVIENAVLKDEDDFVFAAADDDSKETSKKKMEIKKIPEIMDTKNLEEMRIFSMERAVENKDLYRRKIVFAREQELRKEHEPTQPDPAPTSANADIKKPDRSTSSSGTSVAAGTPKDKISTSSTKGPSSSSSLSKSVVAKSKNEGASGATVNVNVNASKPSTVNTSSGNENTEAASGPKVSRNTSASSTPALEMRSKKSRAILCTAANVYFDAMTPPFPNNRPFDVTDIPESLVDAVINSTNTSTIKSDNEAAERNDATNDKASMSNSSSSKPSKDVSNLGAVIAEARLLGKRIEAVVKTSTERSRRRFQFRKDTAYYNQQNKRGKENQNGSENMLLCALKNPFAWSETNDKETGYDMDVDVSPPSSVDVLSSSESPFWNDVCAPRLLSILQAGAGHAIVHDVQWNTRHGRIASFLQDFASKTDSFGPHLIVSTEPDVDRWAKQFKAMESHFRLTSMVKMESLRAMSYKGDPKQRRRLRKRFPDATGLPDASFHVIITSYNNFLKDYIHFYQTPFEIVLLDDGCSWMAAAGESGPVATNAALAKIWEDGIFSKNDHSVGLAGTIEQDWDYGRDYQEDWDYGRDYDKGEGDLKDALIGLTARHRLMTSSRTSLSSEELLPYSRLVCFLAPHFADTVKEEWDRCRIGSDKVCRDHFHKLLARSFVVHNPHSNEEDPEAMALDALQGKIEESELPNDPDVPLLVTDDHFISGLKGTSTRRYHLRWLGPPEDSWLRYELGAASFEPMLEAISESTYSGHVCEEFVTLLATSNAGSTGQVTGSMAYRFAIRCGRSFGSEQGLRQHQSTMHALPGTWLCRICGADCVTSLARTHHERACGQPKFKPTDDGPPPAAGTVTKMQQSASSSATKTGLEKTNAGKEDRDVDGSIRILSYRGVWMFPSTKYFIKIGGERYVEASGVLEFENVDDAAKKYDDVAKKRVNEDKAELNFKPDGSRIIYEETQSSSTTGFGGNLDSVVPALSVINIRDLPKAVKPLLRDPRQTSRTGGNSKRHVYAYRGVCRQARKGHDRWQSQISFCGRNFYLGTYESEWDAAAIYAWAHLILYGKEATDQAQKEGEAAAAAYEKEKQDIAAGIVPPPAPKLSKKEKQEEIKRRNEEKRLAKEKEKKAKEAEKKRAREEQKRKQKAAEEKKVPKKRPVKQEKEKKPAPKKPKTSSSSENLNQLLSKSAGKALVLVPHPQFADITDEEMASDAAKRLVAARNMNYCIGDVLLPGPLDGYYRPCMTRSMIDGFRSFGGAMLLGLDPTIFSWNPDSVISQHSYGSRDEQMLVASMMANEYGASGLNASFQSFVRGATSVIGCASTKTRQMYAQLGLGTADKTLGGPIGCFIDCNIGGSSKGSSEAAACIRYRPTKVSQFQFSALSASDLVTLNGQRLAPELGSFPLFHEDLCTVGPRVFLFLLPAGA